MANIFSSHALSGKTEKAVVSPNEFSSEGRNIGFPTKYSVYVNKISANDGSSNVAESRSLSDIVGNRLYLYHRPSINANGTTTTISVSSGTIDTALTNNKQAYIVFSSLPSSDPFTVSYLAVPDSINAWGFNVLQDDVMEMQSVLGVSNETGHPGLRNLAYGLFDKPDDANLQGFLQRAVYLSHLDQNIVIASTNDSALTGSLGNAHTIQIGRYLDTVVLDGIQINLGQLNGSETCNIWLGNKTGDMVNWSGQLSGEGPVTIGGPSWSNYSGTLGGSLTTGYYNNAMLRVNGDVAVLGDLQAVGSITIINLTGEISTIYGDFTITDKLTVHGVTRTIGLLDSNNILARGNITVNGDIIAGNSAGSGGGGQTLVDNLDPSEVAHTYKTVSRKVLPNTVLNGRPNLSYVTPIRNGLTFGSTIPSVNMCGDSWQISGFATATAGPSGVHPNIIQVNFSDGPLSAVSGSDSTIVGNANGIWCPGLVDPGSLWIKDLNTQFESPIYGYTIESGDSTYVYKLNVFSPELQTNSRVQTNDSLILYNPYSRPYNYITTVGGANPTFSVYADTTYPFEVSFDDEVRKMTTTTSSISLTSALAASITGLTGNPTGVAYIFADSSFGDMENNPGFKTRNIPYRMPKETPVGEVKAYYSGSTWTILQTTSYRPGAKYDSTWIPIVDYTGTTSGRCIGPLTGQSRIYFTHDFGPDVDIYRCSADLYLARYGTSQNSWDKAQPLAHSLMTKDSRGLLGFSGMFTKIPLTNTLYDGASTLAAGRDASLFYMDGKYIGIEFSTEATYAIRDGQQTPQYLRLILRRDS